MRLQLDSHLHPFVISPSWVSLARDLTQWTQPIDNPSSKWRRLATISHVAVNPFLSSISTLVGLCRVKTSDGSIINVGTNVCLAYLGRLTCTFDASRFRHWMRIRVLLTEIRMGGETLVTCASGWMQRWCDWADEVRQCIDQHPAVQTLLSSVWVRKSAMYAGHLSWSLGMGDWLTLTISTLPSLCPSWTCAVWTILQTTTGFYRFCQPGSSNWVLRCTTHRFIPTRGAEHCYDGKMLSCLPLARPKDVNSLLPPALLTGVPITLTSFCAFRHRSSFLSTAIFHLTRVTAHLVFLQSCCIYPTLPPPFWQLNPL